MDDLAVSQQLEKEQKRLDSILLDLEKIDIRAGEQKKLERAAKKIRDRIRSIILQNK